MNCEVCRMTKTTRDMCKTQKSRRWYPTSNVVRSLDNSGPQNLGISTASQDMIIAKVLSCKLEVRIGYGKSTDEKSDKSDCASLWKTWRRSLPSPSGSSDLQVHQTTRNRGTRRERTCLQPLHLRGTRLKAGRTDVKSFGVQGAVKLAASTMQAGAHNVLRTVGSARRSMGGSDHQR